MQVTDEQIDAAIEQAILDKQMAQLDAESDASLSESQTNARIDEAIDAAIARKQAEADEAAKPREKTTMLDVASDLAGGVNELALETADLATAPFRVTGEFITGQDVRSPTEVMSQYGIGGDVRYVDDASVSNALNLLGYGAGMGAGFVPVLRDPSKAGSAVADIMGIGASEMAPAQRLVASLDAGDLRANPIITPGETITPEKISAEVNRRNRQVMAEANRPLYDAAQAIDKKLQAAKGDPKLLDELPPDAQGHMTVNDAVRYMEETFGVSPTETMDALRKHGGIRFDEARASYKPTVMEVLEQDRIFTAPSAARKNIPGPIKAWYERNFVPVTENIRRYGDSKLASAFEKSWERAMRMNANFTDKIMVPMKPVYQYVNENNEAKRLLLNMWDEPENLNIVRGMIRSDLGEENLQAFDRFWAYAQNRNNEARKTLFKAEEGLDDLNYIHTQRRGTGVSNPFRSNPWTPKYAKVDSLRTRSRKLIEEGDLETLDSYDNPLLSHSKYITDQENLLQMTRNMGLKPSLPQGGDEADFFRAVKSRLVNDGWEEARASSMAEMMLDTYQGSKKAPPAPVRAFMNLSYAGTLAQYRSAVLNLHDVAVSMVNNGMVPTLKALTTRMDNEFGISVKELMGEQKFGEFQRDFDKFIQSDNIYDKTSEGIRKFANTAMDVSLFAAMDRVGKGVVLRSAVESARRSARNGRFNSEWSDFFTDPSEMALANRYLQMDMPVKDMPRAAREAIEDMAFAKLGEQQLITAAGRPLGYLNHPMLRPAYAMTGFAIKQQALLRRNVLDELAKGNMDKAASYAARYVLFAGLGYGLIDTARDSVFKAEEFTPEKIGMGVVDQVAAAVSLNRLGDSYSRQMFANNPVEALMQSFLPPGGIVEKGLKGDIVEAIPAVGGVYTAIEKHMEK